MSPEGIGPYSAAIASRRKRAAQAVVADVGVAATIAADAAAVAADATNYFV